MDSLIALDREKTKKVPLRRVSEIIPEREPELRAGPDGRIIPVCEPKLSGRETEYVLDCLKTNWISSTGRYVSKFEKAFSEKCGAQYGIACTSGTTALHLALSTLGIGPGDEVILPTFTMIATPNAVSYCGGRPVLVDADPRTWNLDVRRLEEKITPRTKVILPVHVYGHPAEMDTILSIAAKHRLAVIEDAAEAHGAEYHGKRAGSLGLAGCFSFYPNKIITTGEGGMITTNDASFAEKARNLRDHAFSKERHFWHKMRGFNYRMTNLQGAIGLAQTEKFEEWVEARIQHAKWYDRYLSGISGLILPPRTPGIKNVFWMYAVLVEEEFGITRDALRQRLASQGIETRTFFIPIHLQPIYQRHFRREYPVSEELCRKGLYLPSAATLTESDIRKIATAIRDARKG